VLLDSRLPVMDGPAFLAAARRGAAPWAPVIVLAASEAGLAACAPSRPAAAILKPFALDDLLRLVAGILGPPAA